MSESMESNNKIFNLRITCQKLEEELSFYRNGTTSEQLFDLIKEKDLEIENLKVTLSDTLNKLKRLAKGSAEVLAKCDSLEQEKIISNEEKKILNDKNSLLESNIKVLNNDISELNIKITESNTQLNEFEIELTEREDSIDKLQIRCASLVNDKAEKSKQFDKEKTENSKLIRELRDELDKAMKFNTELKERSNCDHAEILTLKNVLNASEKENKDMKKSILKLKSEGDVLKESLLTSEQEKLNLDIICIDKSNDIKEKNNKLFELEILQKEIINNSQMEEQKRKELFLEELRVKDLRIATLEVYEKEISKYRIHRREVDTAKAKIIELENKIIRQEEYMKKRILKDKTPLSNIPLSNSNLNNVSSNVLESINNDKPFSSNNDKPFRPLVSRSIAKENIRS